MLKEGDKAPAFSLESDDGKKISLKDFKGKTVVIYFYPKDLTPGCTQEACDFQENLPAIKKKKAVVLGISKDPAKMHVKFKEKHGLTFPLLVDDETKVAQAYGVWQEKSLYGKKYMGMVRSTFIIDPAGKIQKVYSNVKVKGHVEDVLDSL